MLKSVIGSILLVLLVLGVAGGIAWYKYQQIQAQMAAPAPPEMPEVVVLGSVKPVTFRRSVTAIGTVLAPQSIDLRTEVVGTIQKIALQSGSIVEEGTVLVKLDDSVEQAQLQGAMAMLKIAESTFRRTSEAASARALTELELEQAEAMLAQSRAEVMRLEAVIRKKTLTAPFRARVGLFDLHAGQYLPEGTRITMLQGVEDYVHVDFSMPQQVADAVKVHEEVTLDDPNYSLKAEIIAIDSQADRLTRSLMARAKIVNPPPSLQPNDSVKVRLEYGEQIQAMAIPASALRRTPSGSIVFVAFRDDSQALRAHQVPVVPGSTQGDDVIILQGLTLGQSVVADGSFKLHENCLLMESTATVSSSPSDTTSRSVGGA